MSAFLPAARPQALKTFIAAIHRLYPPHIANKTWDNTGLLLESPPLPPTTTTTAATPYRVLLTIDLTPPVAAEAIRLNASFILTYHPPIFRALKSLTLADPLQATLLRLAQAGISVYSPHTAVDAAVGGVNDWLADVVSGGAAHEQSRVVIEPVDGGPGHEGAGMGRVLEFACAQTLDGVVVRIKAATGVGRVMVVRGRGAGEEVKRVALCAGSGGGMLRPEHGGRPVDLWVTGELGHHEALAARERGVSVVACFHSNSERGFLRAGMRGRMQTILEEEWAKVEEVQRDRSGWEVVVSSEDSDPFEIV